MKTLKMKSLTKLSSLLLALLFSIVCSNPVNAQDDDSPTVTRFRNMKIKPGEGWAFNEGLKSWMECYGEGEGPSTLQGYWRQTGTGMVFSLANRMASFSEMDSERSDAAKECSAMWMKLVQPHIEEFTTVMNVAMPELSATQDGSVNEVFYVTYFRVKTGMSDEFVKTVKSIQELSGEIKETAPYGYWSRFISGEEHDADFMLATAHPNYASMDGKGKNVWKMIEEKHGKKKSDEMRAKVMSMVDAMWGHIWEYSDVLSYYPGMENNDK